MNKELLKFEEFPINVPNEKKIAKKASDVKSKPSKLYKNYLKYR